MTNFNLPTGTKVTKPSQVAHPELILLYGPPGGGKTYTAATASELPLPKGKHKTLIIDTEGSAAGTIAEFDDDKVDIVRVTEYQQFNDILNQLFDPDVKHEYGVVIVDTFDVAQDWAEDHFDEIAPKGRGGEKDGFWKWARVKEWSELVARGMKSMEPLGILVIHDREEKAVTGGIVTKLRLLGSSRDVLPGIPDVVAYVTRGLNEDDEEETVAQFASQDGLVTKNRFRFPSKVADPNIPKLFQYINDRNKKKDGK